MWPTRNRSASSLKKSSMNGWLKNSSDIEWISAASVVGQWYSRRGWVLDW